MKQLNDLQLTSIKYMLKIGVSMVSIINTMFNENEISGVPIYDKDYTDLGIKNGEPHLPGLKKSIQYQKLEKYILTKVGE